MLPATHCALQATVRGAHVELIWPETDRTKPPDVICVLPPQYRPGCCYSRFPELSYYASFDYTGGEEEEDQYLTTGLGRGRVVLNWSGRSRVLLRLV